MDNKYSLNLDLCQLMFAASRALDAVEGEVLGAPTNHSKRVAYAAIQLGKRLGVSDRQLVDAAVCSVLHDNALTEYVTTERRKGNFGPVKELRDDFKLHCEVGEANARNFPMPGGSTEVILYHHENWDGTGLFGVKGERIPLLSRLIRIADQADVLFNMGRFTPEKRDALRRHAEENAGSLYDPALARPFCELFSDDTAQAMDAASIDGSLRAAAPSYSAELDYDSLIRMSSLFAHIIDYKSPFTLSHSRGIAEKTLILANFYELNWKVKNEVYVAAFLHDLGKLAVPDGLLEKPGKLTDAEFAVVKNHVRITHDILSVVDGFSDIERWASSHHERLDGSGYFRGSRGVDQDFCSRLLACADIYQALTEDRPYRKGMHPDKAIDIMKFQARSGMLDRDIVSAVDRLFVKGLELPDFEFELPVSGLL